MILIWDILPFALEKENGDSDLKLLFFDGSTTNQTTLGNCSFRCPVVDGSDSNSGYNGYGYGYGEDFLQEQVACCSCAIIMMIMMIMMMMMLLLVVVVMVVLMVMMTTTGRKFLLVFDCT